MWSHKAVLTRPSLSRALRAVRPRVKDEALGAEGDAHVKDEARRVHVPDSERAYKAPSAGTAAPAPNATTVERPPARAV